MDENFVVVGAIIVTVPESGEDVVYIDWGFSSDMVIMGFEELERSFETVLLIVSILRVSFNNSSVSLTIYGAVV